MNVMFIVRNLALAHGVERTMTDKANYLAEMGHVVTMVTYEQGLHPCAFPLNPDIHYVDMNCRHFVLYKYSFVRRQIKEFQRVHRFKRILNQLVNEIKPDIIVTPTYTTESLSAILSVRTKTRIIIESHTAFTHDMIGGSFIERIRKYRLLKTIRRCDLLIALTKGDAVYWKKHVRNVVNVANCVSFYPEEVDHSDAINNRIIAVGRLHSQKRFDRLIDAFHLIAQKYPSWYIDIYGDGEDKDKLEKQISGLHLVNRVNLKGTTNDIFTEYMNSQFFVLSSDYEGMPLVLLEAMAHGIPCVSTRCPFGPTELIEDGESGLLADMDINDLSQKMEWMMIHDVERHKMGVKARITASRYRREQIMKEWERAYSSVVISSL